MIATYVADALCCCNSLYRNAGDVCSLDNPVISDILYVGWHVLVLTASTSGDVPAHFFIGESPG